MKNNEKARLDRLERRLFPAGEIEDMRLVDIEVYGEDAVKEIIEQEGMESLMELFEAPDISLDCKEIIRTFIKKMERKKKK